MTWKLLYCSFAVLFSLKTSHNYTFVLWNFANRNFLDSSFLTWFQTHETLLITWEKGNGSSVWMSSLHQQTLNVGFSWALNFFLLHMNKLIISLILPWLKLQSRCSHGSIPGFRVNHCTNHHGTPSHPCWSGKTIVHCEHGGENQGEVTGTAETSWPINSRWIQKAAESHRMKTDTQGEPGRGWA